MNYSDCNLCCLVEPASVFSVHRTSALGPPSVSSTNRLFICALLLKKHLLSDIRMCSCTVRGAGGKRRVMLHHMWCKTSCGPVPSWACPTHFPSWSHQAQSSPCVSQECWERVFKFDSEWTLIPVAQTQTATSLHARLGQCWSQAIQGLHNFWFCWLTHIPKELRGQIDSGLSITKYYFPMHFWNHPTSQFKPGEVRGIWRLQKKFWTAKNERKISWI